jgi:branched-chain amino acid transport system permease protein
MVTSTALSMIIQGLCWLVFGISDKSVPGLFSGALNLGGIYVPTQRLAVGIIGLFFIVGLYFFILKTKTGLAMRAVEQDSDTAVMFGISVNRTSSVAFIVGFALAAIAGGLTASVYALDPAMGFYPVVKAFIIIILGGLGSVRGCIYGGFILGMMDSLTGTFLGAELSYMAGFIILIIVILIRPQGLAGRNV